MITPKQRISSPISSKKSVTSPKVAPHVRPDGGEAFLRDPTGSRPQMHSSDPLAEMLGEEYLSSALSGEDTYLEDLDAVTADELGGPFVASSAEQEFGRDAPETPDATREPFPLPSKEPVFAKP